MQIKSFRRDAVELLQSSFGIRPEAFDAVNMNIADGKNIFRMINSQMLRVTNINQSVIDAPAIRMNHAVETNFTANNLLPRFLRRVRYNLGINLPVAFVNKIKSSSLSLELSFFENS